MAYVVKIVLVLSRLIYIGQASAAAVVPGLNDLQTQQAELLTMKVDEGYDFLQQPNQDPIIGSWVNASSSDSAPANISFLPSGLFGGIWQNTSRRFASPFACQRAALGTSAYMCYLTDAGTLYANITDFQMTFSDGSRWNRLTTTSTTTSTTATSTTATSTTTKKKETVPTQNLVAWYDASNNPTTSGRWMDLSGNGYDLTATGSAAGSTTIDGRPALDFSSGQRYSRSSVPLSSNDVTVIMVVTTASGSWPNWASYMHHGNRDTDWAMEHYANTNWLHFQSQNDNSGNQVQINFNTNYIFVGTYASRVRSLTVYSTSGTRLATSTATDSSYSLGQGSKTLYIGSSDIGEQSNAKFGEILYYQRALSASEIASQVLRLSNKWSRAATVPNQNLVAWYDASNNPTTSRLTDLSGNGYDLTATGSAAGSTTINGRPALDLSGGQKYSRPEVPLSSYDLTVIMVLTTASGSWPTYFSKYMQHGDKDYDWQMGQHDGGVWFRSRGDNSENQVQTKLNTQYIFVGTYASRVRNITVYSIAGQQLGTRTATDASYSLTHGSKTFYVGGADMGESCKGNLGEILYFQRALTTSEIASQVSRLSNKWSVSTQNLVAWYDASNNPTTSGRWMDLSGNGHDLTATGSAAGSTTIDGRPALDFSGGQQYSRSSVPLSSNDVTVIMVVTTASGSFPSWANYMHHGNRDTDWAMEHNAWGSNFLHFQSQNDNSGNQVQIHLNTNYMFVGTYASRVRSLAVYSLSGTQLVTSSATDSSYSLGQGSKTLFVGSSDIGERSNAKFGEILYYQRALGASEIASQVLRLSNKWSRDATVPRQNLVAWYDASNNPTTSGRWMDLSGNGYDLTATESAAGSTTIYGRPALDFSGGKRYSRSSVPLSSNDVTVIMVVTTTSGSWPNWASYMHHGNRDTDWAMEHYANTNWLHFQSQNDNSGNQVQIQLGTQYIFVGTYASRVRSLTVYSLSGTQLGTSSATDSSYSLGQGSKTLFVGSSDIGERSNANFGEILYYQRALGASEIASQVLRLSNKWSR